TLSFRNDACRLLDFKFRRRGDVCLLYFDGALPGDLRSRYVFGKVDKTSARFFGLRDLEGLAHDLSDDLRLANLGGVLRDGLEQITRTETLMPLFVQGSGGALAAHRHERRAVHVGIRYTGDQVGRAGTESG